MSLKTLLTAGELKRMPQDDTVRTELDQGERIPMPPAGLESGENESEGGTREAAGRLPGFCVSAAQLFG